jgi:hypothetical protein
MALNDLISALGRLVDSEPRFLYSCDARPAKKRGNIPESINRYVTQTLACT